MVEVDRQKIEDIHWQLTALHQKIYDMNWGKQTTRRDGDNIKYILEKVQSIDNQVFALKGET